MLVLDLMVPKCAAMIPWKWKVGVSSACTMQYWSSASFLASVFRMSRAIFSGGSMSFSWEGKWARYFTAPARPWTK